MRQSLKPLFYIRFHGVPLGDPHTTWAKRQNGKVSINPDSERTERNVPAPFRDAFGKLSETPDREDPAFWPVKVLNELNYMIVNRDEAAPNTPNLWGVSAREMGERFAPMQQHIRNVKTAYEILAYPHCRSSGSREVIEGELAQDQWANERDQVELSLMFKGFRVSRLEF
jgi:hypothetical protein